MKIKGTKKPVLVLMTLVCALAVGFAAMSITSAVNPVAAYAADDASTTVTLDQAEHFKISDGVLSGLADNIATVVGSKNIEVTIPGTVSEIAGSVSENGILGDYANRLVGLNLGSVTAIGDNAFGKSYTSGADLLTELTIPESVVSIGKKAFANRTGLKIINFNAENCADFTAAVAENPFYRAGRVSGNSLAVTIGEKAAVTKIPANMFLTNASGTDNNRVTSVNFANVNIGEGAFGANAFNGCTLLQTVNIASGSAIAEIGASAFKNCTALEGAPNGATLDLSAVKKIGESAFTGCSKLNHIAFVKDGTGILATIEKDAFSGCTALDTVDLPEGLKSIGDSAFQNCSSFKAITVPNSVALLGTNAFYGCTSATVINYYAANADTSSSVMTSPFANGANNITLNIGSGSAQVTNLPAHLFRSSTQSVVRIKEANFVNVKISNTTTPRSLFGNNLFTGCTTLTKVTFAAGIDIILIGNAAFYGCTSLTDITLPDSVVNILEDAFNGCSALYTINIPSKVSSIKANAFAGCTRLIEVKNESALTINAGDKTNNGGVAANALNVYGGGTGSKIEKNADYIFYNEGSSNSHLIAYVGGAPNLTLPSGAYSIYKQAFKGNTNITSVDASAASITKIDTEAFAGCTSLETITLSNGLNSIGSTAFKGCSSLTAIAIPASVATIGTEAFDGCTSLAKVTFAEKSGEIKYSLTSIYAYAFRNCSSLSVIRIPSTVTSIGDSAFTGCTSLKTVYLPEKLNAVTNAFRNTNGMLLIAPDMNAYEQYASNTLSSYAAYLTYKVVIDLRYDCIEHGYKHGGTNEYHIDYRLYNRDYKLTEQADGSWAEGGLPSQHGYRVSVWYTDDACNTQATDAWWSEQLATKKETITVSAVSISKPELTPKNSLVYNENDTTAPGADRLVDTTIDNKYNAYIAGYAPYYTPNVQAEIPTKQMDAGYYTVAVKLADGYGEWLEPKTIIVTVEPMTADTSFWSSWVATGTAAPYTATELEASTVTALYIYNENGREIPYLAIQKDSDGKDITPAETVEVVRSYLSYTGSEVQVVLAGDANYFTGSIYYTVLNGYTGNSGAESGVYTASVTVAANNNYRFYTDTAGSGNANYGLTVNHVSGTNKYTITKKWYIAVNHMNKPLFNGSETPVLTWDYNSDPKLVKPTLANYGASKEDDLEALISFSLYRAGNSGRPADAKLDTVTAKYSEFGYYINKYMPAGTYVLILNVKDYKKAENETYAGGTYTYTFNVEYGFNNIGTLTSHQGNNAWSYAYDGKPHFGEALSELEVLGISAADLHLQNRTEETAGYWGKKENGYMYQGYSIMYDIVAGRISNDGKTVNYAAATGNYLTAEDYEKFYREETQALPCEIGFYRVYYYVYAPSYKASLTDIRNTQSADFFNIKIYGEVKKSDLPSIASVAFTNKSVTPAVNDVNGWFNYYWLDKAIEDGHYSYEATKWAGADTYVNAGTHYLALTLKDIYANLGVLVWAKDEIDVRENDNKTVTYAKVPFMITPAQNVSYSLTFNPWNWGQYNATANRPVWNTQYGDYKDFTFTLTSVDDPTKVYTYGGGEGKDFIDADAGNYNLKAFAAGNTTENTLVTGYNWYEMSAELAVTILPAYISWTGAPYMVSWKYGGFATRVPLTEGVLAASYGDLKDKIYENAYYCLVEDIDTNLPSKRKKTLTDFVNDEGEVPAGDYALVYWLEGTVNYEKWVYPVLFSVIKADNHWEITPTVTGWYYGDANIDYETYKPEYKPYKGDKASVKIEYCELDEYFNEISVYKETLALLRLDENGHLPVGNYKLRATMPETVNYAAMEFEMNFTVARAQNSWKDIPGVVSWQEGRWSADKNSFVAADLYGSTVRITIMDANGTIIVEKERMDELNVNVLKKLGVGAYTLIAYVDETYSHEGLESKAYFAVLEDSVGITGLIAATVVFAVIAIGLAAAATVFLIRRNRKIEEEFRNMVKSELNRR